MRSSVCIDFDVRSQSLITCPLLNLLFVAASNHWLFLDATTPFKFLMKIADLLLPAASRIAVNSERQRQLMLPMREITVRVA